MATSSASGAGRQRSDYGSCRLDSAFPAFERAAQFRPAWGVGKGVSPGAVAPSSLRARLWFVALALSTITVGLIVHWRGAALPTALRDVLGDALWAMMIYGWVGALAPKTRSDLRAGMSLAICWAVELSQLYHGPIIDGWRRTTPGQLVLGSGFDLRDLGAYALGVLMALMVERTTRRRFAWDG
ncbi:MAG: DUF2809 domain-containing protein [Gemmatimonadota bacterium]